MKKGPMTEKQKHFRTCAIAENHIARQFKGKRLPHKDEFDVETQYFLIEVKAIRIPKRKYHFCKYARYNDKNPNIHIAQFSLDGKNNIALVKGKIAILIACVIVGNKVKEMKYGNLKKHTRYNSLFPISDLPVMDTGGRNE